MPIDRHVITALTSLFVLVFGAPLHAASQVESKTLVAQANSTPIQKAAYSPPTGPSSRSPGAAAADETGIVVFSAPPRETTEVGRQKYEPVAAYLSKVLNRKVVYRHPGTWGVYRTKMLRGDYDLLFDGPHFNSYRAEKLQHNILAKIAKRHEFVVIVRKGSGDRYTGIGKMAGRTFCTHAPPNLGTLTLLSQFNNPARQPVIINTKGWGKIYEGVISGKCVGGILPILNLSKYDTQGKARIVFKANAMPNQAFSAGPRISPEDQAKIAAALVSPDAREPTEKLRAAYKVGETFVAASNQEYTGIAEYLKNEWGYY